MNTEDFEKLSRYISILNFNENDSLINFVIKGFEFAGPLKIKVKKEETKKTLQKNRYINSDFVDFKDYIPLYYRSYLYKLPVSDLNSVGKFIHTPRFYSFRLSILHAVHLYVEEFSKCLEDEEFNINEELALNPFEVLGDRFICRN